MQTTPELPPFGGKWRRALENTMTSLDTGKLTALAGRLLRTRRPDITDQETKLEV